MSARLPTVPLFGIESGAYTAWRRNVDPVPPLTLARLRELMAEMLRTRQYGAPPRRP